MGIPVSPNAHRLILEIDAALEQQVFPVLNHALGVTTLSSDMGKLYVVLAQAIHRLRN